MAFDNFKPRLWHDMILDNLDNNLVMGSLANREYEGEIKGKGSSVKILEVGNVTVNSYTGASITYEDLDDASKILLIDQQKYAAVQLDDVDSVQANANLMGKLSDRLSYGIANNIDSYLAGLYGSAGVTSGSTSSVTSVTSSNIDVIFTTMGKLLDEQNVPGAGRVAVITPWMKEKMLLAKVSLDTNNSATLANGQVGQFLGFDVFVSNNISHSSTTWYAPLFFVRDYTVALAQQLMKVEALRSEDSFKDKMRALSVYGAKVIQPYSLGVAYVSAGSES